MTVSALPGKSDQRHIQRSLRITIEMDDQLQKLVEQRESSVSRELRLALRDYLNAHQD